jgi:hypothetical protein
MLTAPPSLENDQMATWDALATRLLTLDERVWEGRATGPAIRNWLNNFKGKTGASAELEQLHALYVLSQFMYFGSKEIRILLRALYRELFLLPLAQKVRAKTKNASEFCDRMALEKDATRFLGVGNPSESGVHLLYYFRQENSLAKASFLDSAQIYTVSSDNGIRKRVPRHPSVKRYVFLDDICGTGETAERYSNDLLPDLLAEQPDVELWYFSLFATADGLRHITDNTAFGSNCGAVYELDDTYRWTATSSRYLSKLPKGLYRSLLIALPAVYGATLLPGHPLGYDGSELMLGFSHNTPDNTLPIIWFEMEHGAKHPWYPIFRRYPKV